MSAYPHPAFNYLDTVIGDRKVPLFRLTGGSPTNGTSGSFAGVADTGTLLLTDEPGLYSNTGTQASPTWTPVNIAGGNGSNQPTVGALTGPASTSVITMQGLGGVVTPKKSGNLLVMVSGTIQSSSGTAGVGLNYQISYGTGVVPINGAALVGTQVGPTQQYTNPAAVTAADVNVPFAIQFLITGLTVGTAYWFDIAAKALSITGASFANLSETIIEV
jgi:hypothetical protein